MLEVSMQVSPLAVVRWRTRTAEQAASLSSGSDPDLPLLRPAPPAVECRGRYRQAAGRPAAQVGRARALVDGLELRATEAAIDLDVGAAHRAVHAAPVDVELIG